MVANTSGASLTSQQRRYLPDFGYAPTIRAVSDDGGRRGKITEEHRREAAALKALWASTSDERAARGVRTQEAFGIEYGIGNQAAVWQFLNGKTALSLAAALGFAKGMRCNVGDFSPRLAAAIGEGPADAHTGPVPFSAELLERLRRLDAKELRKAENILRLQLEMPPLPAVEAHAAGPEPVASKRQRAA